MKAMVLCAGEGSRLRPLTLQIPKSMVLIAGRPLLEWILMWLHWYGIRDIAVNLHHKAEAIVSYFGDGGRLGVRLTYSLEDRLLGTAGGVRKMAEWFGGAFLVVYGDLLTDISLSSLVRAHRSWGGAVTLALTHVEDPARAGMVAVDSNGRLISFQEKPLPGQIDSNWANGGIYVMEPYVLDRVPLNQNQDFGRDLFPLLLQEGVPLYGCKADGYLLDIGSLERYSRAEQDVARGLVRLYTPLERTAIGGQG